VTGPLRVDSEIGRLRRVLVHEPGLEVDHMVPATMDELLFDDVLYGERARNEHRLFRRIFQVLGVEVVEALDVLAATLDDPEARGWILDRLPEDVPQPLAATLRDAPGRNLAVMLTAGVRRETAGDGFEVGDLFAVPPLPNWCFQRDPQVVLGTGVIHGAMATRAREREGLLARTMFAFHPELRRAPVLHDPAVADDGAALEGGDVAVFGPDIVAVGHSERTCRRSIEALAASLSALEDGPRWLLVVELPKRRAYMHLDTVITQLDAGHALVFPPVVESHGGQGAPVFEIDLHGAAREPAARGSLLEALAHRGTDLEPVPCGGSDPLRQQREQWTDGANALALAPGVVVIYERNTATLDTLARHGYAVVEAEDLVLGRKELHLDRPEPTCIALPSTEISRARGGPHCLSHPLLRDPV
jgi:arginine deiminase